MYVYVSVCVVKQLLHIYNSNLDQYKETTVDLHVFNTSELCMVHGII